jgi:hypothetical protein
VAGENYVQKWQWKFGKLDTGAQCNVISKAEAFSVNAAR